MDLSVRTPKLLGAQLRRQRKKLKISQATLSDRISKRQATISSLETDGIGTLETLFAVLSALDLELTIQPRRGNRPPKLEEIF